MGGLARFAMLDFQRTVINQQAPYCCTSLNQNSVYHSLEAKLWASRQYCSAVCFSDLAQHKEMAEIQRVAMQVIDAAMVFKLDEDGMPLEASLGIKLRHPNIVLLIDYATHVSTVAFHPRTTRCFLLQSPGSSRSFATLFYNPWRDDRQRSLAVHC